MEQTIQLSDHFGYRRLIRFTIPSILMMIFTSIYGVVDGFFVSNFVGKTSFAAVNFIMPFLMITGVMGFMFGTGGSALIAKIMGEGKKEKAQKIFSLLIMATIICGIVIGAISIIFLRPVAVFLGARGEMLEECIIYGRIILVALPFLMLQYAFSSLAVTAEKPKLGLIVTVTAGVINMVGDALFMAVFQWGIAGAAMASALGQIVGGIIPLIYFARKNTSRLRIVRPEWDGRALLRICTNGCSELMSNISMSVVGMLYNYTAYEICRRRRGDSLRYDHVCEFYFYCNFHWLCNRCCAGDQLSLWCREYKRTEKFAEKKFCIDFDFICVDVWSIRTYGKATGRYFCRI